VSVSPLAGKPAPAAILANIPRLVTAYYTERPDPAIRQQRVAFGTYGHRGSAFKTAFNEWHILAMREAICRYREQQNITGPLFLGMDTHALSEPAFASALEVLVAHGVDVMHRKWLVPRVPVRHGGRLTECGVVTRCHREHGFNLLARQLRRLHKIHAESFRDDAHLRRIQEEAQGLISMVCAAA
jgi:phosphoglucomutase